MLSAAIDGETSLPNKFSPPQSDKSWTTYLSGTKLKQLYSHTIETNGDFPIVDYLSSAAALQSKTLKAFIGAPQLCTSRVMGNAKTRARQLETNILIECLHPDHKDDASLLVEDWAEELALHYSVDVATNEYFIEISKNLSNFHLSPKARDVLEILGHLDDNGAVEDGALDSRLELNDDLEEKILSPSQNVLSPKRHRPSNNSIGRRASELLEKTKCGLDIEAHSNSDGSQARYSLPQPESYRNSWQKTNIELSPRRKRNLTISNDLTIILETPPKAYEGHLISRSSTPGCSQAINSLNLNDP